MLAVSMQKLTTFLKQLRLCLLSSISISSVAILRERLQSFLALKMVADMDEETIADGTIFP
jgi:hypothetical protein